MKFVKELFNDINIYKYVLKKYSVYNNHYTLGRWSSSIDKMKWEKYADFANYDNCCCSKNNSNMNIYYIDKNKNKNKKTITR